MLYQNKNAKYFSNLLIVKFVMVNRNRLMNRFQFEHVFFFSVNVCSASTTSYKRFFMQFR